MKKYFLAVTLFCGITSIATARSGAVRTSTEKKARLIGEKNKREKKAAASASAARRKKTASKKHTATPHRKSVAAKRTTKSKRIIAKERIIPVKSEGFRSLNSDEIKIGDDFASNHGKLPWPVDGSVSLPYGAYTIDGTRIKGNNPGIMFSTIDNSEPVKAVFDGIVTDVSTKGEISSVCIRHGKYTTVYGNLSAINVNKGDTVKKNQVIARIGDGYDSEGGELTFLLMVDSDNVNPAPWLTH